MKATTFVVALAVSIASASAAMAANDMILLSANDLTQKTVLSVTGDFNRLVISQAQAGDGAGNSIAVGIAGDNNGGPSGAVFNAVAAKAGLQPGGLVQQGFGNSIDIDVKGDSNLFAVAQLGSNNTVRGAITGMGNQAAVMQAGVNNFASFSQQGIGNSISVQQYSW